MREAARLVGVGARTVESAERLLAFGHVAHRRRQFELGDRRPRLAELDSGLLHRRQALGRKLRLVMGEANGDARRPVELGDRHVRHGHQRGAEQGDVLDAAGIAADRIEPLGVGLHAGYSKMTIGRLVADDAAECGGPDHRAAGLRAGAQRHLEVGDRSGRARRRAARRVRWIVRVPGRTGMAVGEFRRHGLAQKDCALATGQRHGRRIGQRLMGPVDRRAVGRGLVPGIDDVLHAHRDAVQQALAWSAIKHSGAFQCSLARQMRPGEHLGIALVDALEMGTHDRLRRHRPGIDPLREFGGGKRVRRSHDRG
jgi:hypothetical protein